MERNKYELQRGVLARKYADILRGFEAARDDRRVAWNCYQQIIAACEAMRDSEMENSFICCAVNKSIREQEAENQVQQVYGEQYSPILMFDSKKAVSRMLHEDIERQAVRRMMRQAHKEQQTFQKKKSEQER